MVATVPCSRVDIKHSQHYYGANNSWWCPGADGPVHTVTVVGSKPDELPIEHELIDGAWYSFPNGAMQIYRENAEFHGKDVSSFYRMAPVARYEAPAPEVKEPTGLGAVVTDRLEDPWVRGLDDLWHGPADTPYHWDHIPRPVVVCSEGWKP